MAKTFSILGDSISTFAGVNPSGYTLFYSDERLAASGVTSPNDTWWAHVVRALAGEVLAVDAWSGSMVEGAGFPAGCSEGRAQATLGPAKPLLVEAGLANAELLGAEGAAPDVILCFIGINDYGWGGARAQAAGRSHAMPPCANLANIPKAVPGVAPADAAELFGCAYETMLRNLHAVAPEALIYAISLLPGRTEGMAHPEFTYRLRGVHLDEYNAAIKQAVENCNSLVQKGDTHQFRYVDVRTFGRDYASLEGTHPTNLGMRQFASMVVRGMQVADEQAKNVAGVTDVPNNPSSATNTSSYIAEGTTANTSKQTLEGATANTNKRPLEGATANTNPGAANPALDLTNFCDAPTSEEFCSKPNCIGCPFVTDTSCTWMCTCKKLA